MENKELLDWYQEQAKRTVVDLGEKMNLAHMVLGIHSEYNELINSFKSDKENRVDDIVSISDESGDMYWYLSNYCTFKGYNLSDLDDKDNYQSMNLDSYDKLLVYTTSILQDLVKKYVVYDKPINQDKEIKTLGTIALCLNKVIEYSGFSLERSLKNNIAKLRVRFPDKFSSDLAINKNEKKERLELEK